MRRLSVAIVEVRRFDGAGGPAADARARQPFGRRSPHPDHRAGRHLARPSLWSSANRCRSPWAGSAREARDAMQARAEHLADEGLARRQGQRIILQRDLLNTLRRRELDAVGEKLSAETGLPHVTGRGGRACRRHLSPASDALLRPLRHDRQRAWLPAGALVTRDRAEARPARRGRRPGRRRHRVEPGAQARTTLAFSHDQKGSLPCPRPKSSGARSSSSSWSC